MLGLRLRDTRFNQRFRWRIRVRLLFAELRNRDRAGEHRAASESIEQPPCVGMAPSVESLISALPDLVDLSDQLAHIVDRAQ